MAPGLIRRPITPKPDPDNSGAYDAYVKKKQKIILTNLKRTIAHVPDEDDPFGDKELFANEVAKYLALEGRKAEPDSRAKNPQFRHVVRTKMFGGEVKHVKSEVFEEYRRIREDSEGDGN